MRAAIENASLVTSLNEAPHHARADEACPTNVKDAHATPLLKVRRAATATRQTRPTRQCRYASASRTRADFSANLNRAVSIPRSTAGDISAGACARTQGSRSDRGVEF